MRKIPKAAYPNALRRLYEDLGSRPEEQPALLNALAAAQVLAEQWVLNSKPLPPEETGMMLDRWVTPNPQTQTVAWREGAVVGCGCCSRSLQADIAANPGETYVRCSSCGLLNDLCRVSEIVVPAYVGINEDLYCGHCKKFLGPTPQNPTVICPDCESKNYTNSTVPLPEDHHPPLKRKASGS